MWVTVQPRSLTRDCKFTSDKKILKDKIAYAHSVMALFCQEYHDKVVNKYCIFKDQTQVYY